MWSLPIGFIANFFGEKIWGGIFNVTAESQRQAVNGSWHFLLFSSLGSQLEPFLIWDTRSMLRVHIWLDHFIA